MNEIKMLSELAVYLKNAAETFSQKEYEELYQELRVRYEQQVMEALMDRHPGWSVLQGNVACMMYLYRNWPFSRKVEENAARLTILADDFFENYEECDDVFLTAKVATETMKIAERVYDFSKQVLRNQHMFIFLFQTKHRNADSFCRCINMADGRHLHADSAQRL